MNKTVNIFKLYLLVINLCSVVETGEFQLPTDGLDTGGQDVELDLQRSSKHSVRIGRIFNV